MIEILKKLFSKDKTIELHLIEIIKQQQEFIAKNINERVVYVDPQSGYTNVERFDDPNAKKEDEEEEFPEVVDLTPELLREQMEGSQDKETKPEEGQK